MLLPLGSGGLLFRIESGIGMRLHSGPIRVDRHFSAAAGGRAALQSQIVGNAKSPAAQIMARFFAHEMLKEREEHFLHYFFAILNAQPGRAQITKKSIPQGVEQKRDLFFKSPGADRTKTGLSRDGNG